MVIFTNHAAVKHLIAKKYSKPRLIRWILLLQELDLEICEKKGVENVVADHLAHLPLNDSLSRDIPKTFPDETLMAETPTLPWYAGTINYLVTGQTPGSWDGQKRKRFISQATYFHWEEPELFKIG